MSRNRTAACALVVLTMAAAAAGCGDNSDDHDGGAIERGLEQIPRSVYDRVDDGSSPMVEIADIAALSRIDGLATPAPGRDQDEISDSLVALTGGGATNGARIVVGWLGDPSPGIARPADFDDEIGLDVGAVETFAALIAPPLTFTAYTGDVRLSDSLDVVADGVRTLGSGRDLAISADGRSALSRLGVPLRLGEKDGEVALSTSTPAIESWLDGDGDSLADDDRYTEVAQAFDRLEAPTALIAEAGFGLDPIRVLGSGVSPDEAAQDLDDLDGQVIEQPFDIVGVGGAEIDGDASVVAVYLFDSEDDATAAVDTIENVWSDSQLAQSRQSIDELLDLTSVTADGRTVTVVARPLEGRSTRIGSNFLLSREVVFQHR